jgi:Flp pilus assembly protein TadD
VTAGREAVDQARGLLEIERGTDAIAVLTGFLAEHPQDAPALSLLAWAHLQCDRPDAALRAADEALLADPDYQAAWQRRSWALRALGRHEDAVTAAHQYVRLAPHSWASHYTLGMMLRSRPGRGGEVLAAATRAVELAPTVADPHVLQGLAYADDNQPVRAEACYRHALSIDPAHAHARSNLSALALRRGHFAEAIRGFRSAAQARPQEVMFHRNIAVAVVNSLLKYGYVLALSSVVFAALVAFAITPGDPVDPAVSIPTILVGPTGTTTVPGNAPVAAAAPAVVPVAPHWAVRVGAVVLILLAWLVLLGTRLRPLSAYLRGHIRAVFSSLLRTARFLPLFAGFLCSQACAFLLLLAPGLSDSVRGDLVLGAGAALAGGSVLGRALSKRRARRASA